MVSSINVSLQGLDAVSKRIEVASQNIANQNSTKTVVNGQLTDQPYVPQQVNQVSQEDGGVTVQISSRALQQLASDAQNNTGSLGGSSDDSSSSDILSLLGGSSDPTDDELSINSASYDFKANLKAIQVQDTLNQSLLDIVS